MDTNKLNSKEDSISDVVYGYTKYWFYFFLSVLAFIISASIFLRYANPIYSVSSTIIIKDEKSGGGAAELAALTDLSFFSNFSSSKIDSELTILESKTLIAKTVENLGLNVRYFNQGTFKTTELYEYKPFIIKFQDVSQTQLVPQLEIILQKNQRYSLTIVDTETTIENAQFGEKYVLPFADIVLLPNQSNTTLLETFIEKNILVEYKNIESVASSFSSNLELNHDGKNGEVVQLNLKSPKPAKGEKFLNELVHQYNVDARKDKSQIANKTAEFIDSRLEIITEELDSVEKNKERFKTNNRLTDIDTEAALVLENSNEFSKRQVDLLTRLEMVDSYYTYVINSDDNQLLPVTIGFDNQSIAAALTGFNTLISDRQRLLSSSTENNPVVQNLESQIKDIKRTILKDVDNQRKSIASALSGLKSQEDGLNSRLSKVPYQEKMFREILRQQNIKEELYLFLLKQREETAITLAVTSDKAKVVDSANTLKIPVFPNKLFVYLLAFILGIAIPFLIISLYNLLSTRVQSRKDVERIHVTTPVIGEVPKLGRADDELVKQNDHSILAESFRILRTNLQYLLLQKNAAGKVNKKVIVTSTIKGEGKTFVAFNLALTLSLTGKRVVLVGADIRNPQLQRYLPPSYKNNIGFTEYIVDKTVKVDDLVLQSEYDSNLSLVLSGAIPPNPAELLLQPRVDAFFEEIEHSFDFIIIDTAPSMLVTDTLLLSKHADVTVYVIRANYTDKKLLEFSYDAIQEKKLHNVALVVNDVTLSNFGYGNKYGYTYTATKKTYWQRLFQR
ncbi:polysaccharide biosynthesis tyrosine autokinase [Flavobacteriaceae bacterium]|nr:polysaccharide biosynthesis tyrosine autokinase [Flavobacteriaceae bacterium]